MAARCKAWGFCACVLGAVAQLGGCADDGVSAHVICAIEPEVEDNVCTYDVAGDTCLLSGVMNVAATGYYRQNLRVESGLKPRVRDVPPQSETARIALQSAKVELRSTRGERIDFERPDLPNPYRVTATGFIPPGGVGASSVTLIAPNYAAALAAKLQLQGGSLQIVIAVTLDGETDGQTSVSSGEFVWPVTLINVSSDPVDNDCRKVESCAGSFGQDNFATACRPQ